MNVNWSNLLAPEYLPYVLPAAVVLAACLIVLLLMLGRKKVVRVKVPKSGNQTGGLDLGQSAADRRNSVRRDGAPVEVVVTSPAFKAGANNGYVLDRSTGGMKLALAAGMAPGGTLQVRAKHAPDSTPWVTVVVRSCRPNGDYYEIGCEFEKTPPWNVLLLFG
jgi:hypothetical protein